MFKRICLPIFLIGTFFSIKAVKTNPIPSTPETTSRYKAFSGQKRETIKIFDTKGNVEYKGTLDRRTPYAVDSAADRTDKVYDFYARQYIHPLEAVRQAKERATRRAESALQTETARQAAQKATQYANAAKRADGEYCQPRKKSCRGQGVLQY